MISAFDYEGISRLHHPLVKAALDPAVRMTSATAFSGTPGFTYEGGRAGQKNSRSTVAALRS